MTVTLRFGANIDPSILGIETAYSIADYADRVKLDLIGVQDHPYNRRHLDTWTLLTALGVRTKHVNLVTNVANLPLRPPAMLAKAAATLDVLTGGRVEVGLGAGAFWTGVRAMGGEERTPAQAYAAFEDAVTIIRGLWNSGGRGVTYRGEVYHLEGAQFGPAPAHPIPLWVGASGPKMLRLTGRLADGIWVSSTYEPPARLLEINARINEGAAEAGRPPEAIRRGYNVMGLIDYGQIGGKPAGLQPGILYGTPQDWVTLLHSYQHEYGMDTFMFWGVGDDEEGQLRAFAEDVVPALRSAG